MVKSPQRLKGKTLNSIPYHSQKNNSIGIVNIHATHTHTHTRTNQLNKQADTFNSMNRISS